MIKPTDKGTGSRRPRGGRTEGEAAEQPPDDQPAFTQSEKFIQAAREAGCDKTGEKLDEALRTIGQAGHPRR